MPEHAVVLQDTRPYKAAAPQILPFFLSLGNQRKAKEKHAERSQQPGALLIPAVPPCCQLQPPAAPAALCAPRLESGCISQHSAAATSELGTAEAAVNSYRRREAQQGTQGHRFGSDKRARAV